MAEANQDLRLRRGHVIPAVELSWTFGTSSGPGGQHANRVQTRAQLHYDLVNSTAFDDAETAQIERRLARRLRDGVLTVTVDETRSQWRNRQLARARLAEALDDALAPEAPKRRATRPTAGARRRRLEDKRQRSQTKRLRRKPEAE